MNVWAWFFIALLLSPIYFLIIAGLFKTVLLSLGCG